MATVHPKKRSRKSNEAQWPELRRRVVHRAKRRNLASLFSDLDDATGVLRWGIAAALNELPAWSFSLNTIAVGGKSIEPYSWESAAHEFVDAISTGRPLLETLAEALHWAYALPKLANLDPEQFPESLWWRVLDELQALCRVGAEETRADSPERLLAGGELGLVLAWQLADLPSCAALLTPSVDAARAWFAESGDAVVAALQECGRWSRLCLASAIRTRRLLAKHRERISVKHSGAAVDLATWSAAMMRVDGSRALGASVACSDDTSSNGLFAVATHDFGGNPLKMAVDASLSRLKSDGRLAWRVTLPEPGWYEETAGLAVMLPEWDVRRGRLALDFSGNEVRIEVGGGKRPLISGTWSCRVQLDGSELKAISGWRELCWYSDDDLHYLEIEQSLESGIRVQRQILQIRDDRCLMLADAVIGGVPGEKLTVESGFPLAATVHVEEERELRDLLLVDGKKRASVMPIGLPEWKVGPSHGNLVLDDPAATNGSPQGLIMRLSASGQVSVYSPLWIDLHGPRIRSARTWRKLAIAQKLRLVDDSEALAYRVHAGHDQWLVYRSLTGAANRTFLGKNLISDFFCGRFDAEDGSVEELISVDEQGE